MFEYRNIKLNEPGKNLYDGKTDIILDVVKIKKLHTFNCVNR